MASVSRLEMLSCVTSTNPFESIHLASSNLQRL